MKDETRDHGTSIERCSYGAVKAWTGVLIARDDIRRTGAARAR